MNSLHINHKESPYKVSKWNQAPTQNTHTDTNIKLLNKVLIQNLQSLKFKLYIYRQKIVRIYQILVSSSSCLFCQCHYLVQTMNNLNFSQACLVGWVEKREDCRERVARFESRQRQREGEMRREEIEGRRGWIVKVEGMEMFLDHKWIEFIADIPKAIFYTL